MPLNDALVELITGHYFLQATPQLSGDENVYLGVSTADPGDDGTGINEPPASSGYARVPIGSGSETVWSVEEFGGGNVSLVARNKTDILFPEATADWPAVNSWFISTSVSGGVADRFYQGLGTTITVSGGQQLAAPANFFRLRAIAANNPVRFYASNYVTRQVLASVVSGESIPYIPTYMGIHLYPFFKYPSPQGSGTFGEIWDWNVASNYVRVFVWPASSSPLSPRWVEVKLGEIENEGNVNLGINIGQDWNGLEVLTVMDSAGTDPGFAGGSPLPAGSGGGNLLFFTIGPLRNALAGDTVRCLDAAWDMEVT